MGQEVKSVYKLGENQQEGSGKERIDDSGIKVPEEKGGVGFQSTGK